MDTIRRRARGDLEDPEHSVVSNHSHSSGGLALHEIMMPMAAPMAPPPQPPPPLQQPQMPLFNLNQLRSHKTTSDWAYIFAVLILLGVITLLFGLLYAQANPTLQNFKALSGMMASKQPQIEEAIDHALALINGTSVDMMQRYADIINQATEAMNHARALIDDPQTQRNIQAITYGISRGDFERIGHIINAALKVAGAISQSAGDDGITIKVGDWRKYIADSDTAAIAETPQ